MTVAIMIQGTGSNVGKSLLVAGLLRAVANRGMSAAPFKPQNMSNNAAVAVDGGEIGRAQALQARAARRQPVVDMNPVLLKPESETGAQVILRGQRHATLRAADYAREKPALLPAVVDSFRRLAAGCDLVVVEGAGSPAEINLRSGDIANMGFAEAAGLPVILAGDIDRGGVIAQIVGTAAVLDPPDRDRIRGFVVNKFRGDPALFAEGMAEIARRTGWAPVGLVPWFDAARLLPAEDILDIRSRRDGRLRIAVPRLGRIANFDDLDPLLHEPDVALDIVEPGRALPGDADLVILPGSKSTIADLQALREAGWHIDLAAHVRRGGHVLGICGGYQMLGRTIADPEGIEGTPRSVEGLGLLDVDTVMAAEKHLALRAARSLPDGLPVSGYEIHIGRTEGPDCTRGWLEVEGAAHGASSADGRILGCYLHGIFSADAFRAAFLSRLGLEGGQVNYEAAIDDTLDRLAAHLEAHVDLDHLLALAAPVA